jgi:hypothetical protein
MTSTRAGLSKAVISAAATALLALPAVSPAATKVPPSRARVSTGPATHILGTSVLLTAIVRPNGTETSYYFVYGPTTAYGSQTPTVSAGHGETKVPVGQPVTGLQPGVTYHFRVLGVTNPPASTPLAIKALEGRDHIFTTKGVGLAFTVPKTSQDVFGTPFILSGVLTGLASANHRIALQASPYPFLEAFTNIGVPGVTNGSGRFSFRVANLSSATQLRLVTLDPLPVYSPVMTVNVQVHVVLHVRSSGQPGLVRLYGTVAPAIKGAKVYFQVQKAVRPGRSEVSIRYVTQFSTVARKGPGNTSRFSTVATIKRGGRYRAYVIMPKGPLASGPSQTSYVLHASPNAGKHK